MPDRSITNRADRGLNGATAQTLTSSGFLPPGIHDMSLDEVGRSFGSFRSTDRRPSLFRKLEQFADQARTAGFVRFLIVNGSFISSKTDPGDIDLIVVIDPQILEAGELPPFQYNVLSSRRIRKAYPFDVFVVYESSAAYAQYLSLFSRIKGQPDDSKGVVRVRL
jgi:hypothetical protein